MTYTPEVIIKAAELANVPLPEAGFLASLLDEATYLVSRQKPNYVPTTVDHLFRQICHVSGFTGEQLKAKGRKREISYVRHAYAAIALELFPRAGLEYIGSFVGVRHDMVLYYVAQVREVREKREVYQAVKEKLNIPPKV